VESATLLLLEQGTDDLLRKQSILEQLLLDFCSENF
jgi:hypothetical protein